MGQGLIERLSSQCGGSRDGALLRLGLAQALLNEGRSAEAIVQLRRALEFDAHYSVAWKLLGRALTDCGDHTAALAAYERGIAVAAERGDKQAEKEMRVFLKRLQRDGGADAKR